jgi:hypothetical protein
VTAPKQTAELPKGRSLVNSAFLLASVSPYSFAVVSVRHVFSEEVMKWTLQKYPIRTSVGMILSSWRRELERKAFTGYG